MQDKIDDFLTPKNPETSEDDRSEVVAAMAGLSIESAERIRLISELQADLELIDTNIRRVEESIRNFLEQHDQSSNNIYTLSGTNPLLYAQKRSSYVLINILRAKKKRLTEKLAFYKQ